MGAKGYAYKSNSKKDEGVVTDIMSDPVKYPDGTDTAAMIVLPKADVLRLVSKALNAWMSPLDLERYTVTHVEITGQSGRIFFQLTKEAKP